MKESEYYTPSIEEFYVGFEYEHLNKECDSWLPCFYETMLDQRGNSKLDELNMSLEKVKYLDKEDIESLRWKDNSYSTFPNGVIEVFKLKHYVFSYYRDEYSTVFEYTILDELRNKRLYLGEIKNKSELIKLLKQLNIK